MVPNKLPVALAGMTLAEAGAAYYWMGAVATAAGQGGVYAFPAVTAGVVLWFGLLVEDGIVVWFQDPASWNPFRGGALAVTEVVAWSQWANIVLLGLYSATGVGPATVVLAALLTLQHGVETNLLFGERAQLRHAVTALVEATTVTTGWTLLATNGMPGLGFLALVFGFSVEHGYRLTAVTRTAGGRAGDVPGWPPSSQEQS
jgi:hypothetical protein